MGGPLIEHHAHWGAKVSRGLESFPTVLLADFGIGIDSDGIVHLVAYAFAGRDKVMGGGRSCGPVLGQAPMRSVQLRREVENLVSQVEAEIETLLQAFSSD